ncbi:MarR family winged helix-turn-helix transcriptional regulator [Myceligenerans indicum]|uniref:MarR family transcriptional regulator n=1 Tax=Myceligenerans indicum TaxID=2593663 RepID=A0ABS1LKM9_9MICO|nr:MarR family transcriptional regulator [Myceligenerans indicum]MBL0886733.1 MarR family transcriptional regulator [Myceligenerans indicum]
MEPKGIPGLNAEESTAWMSLMAMTMWLPAALDVQLSRDEGISNFEYGALAALAQNECRSMRIKDLARMANGTFPRLSKMIDRFEKQGWVIRRPDPDDGRATRAVLTAEGLRKVAVATPAHIALARELVFDQLTSEQVEQLTTITQKVFRAAGPDGACASRMT